MMPPVTKATDAITVCEKFPLFTDSQGKVKEVEVCYKTTAGEYFKDHPLTQFEELKTKKVKSPPLRQVTTGESLETPKGRRDRLKMGMEQLQKIHPLFKSAPAEKPASAESPRTSFHPDQCVEGRKR